MKLILSMSFVCTVAIVLECSAMEGQKQLEQSGEVQAIQQHQPGRLVDLSVFALVKTVAPNIEKPRESESDIVPIDNLFRYVLPSKIKEETIAFVDLLTDLETNGYPANIQHLIITHLTKKYLPGLQFSSNDIHDVKNVFTLLSDDIFSLWAHCQENKTEMRFYTTLDSYYDKFHTAIQANEPGSLKKIKGIESLCLTNKSLTTFSLELFMLAGLKKLDLYSNKLKELPDSIDLFIHLENLDVSDNMLKELPATIYKLKKLKCLNLANNFFKFIPKIMANSICLVWLYNNPCVSTVKDYYLDFYPFQKYYEKHPEIFKGTHLDELPFSGVDEID